MVEEGAYIPMDAVADQQADEADDGFIDTLSITPVISVCLVLLIILIITLPVINIPNVAVNLPAAKTQESKERNITVSFSRDGIIAVKTNVVERDMFVKRLKYELHNTDNPLVILRADKDASYREVEQIIRLIKQAGAVRIAFGTEQRINGK